MHTHPIWRYPSGAPYNPIFVLNTLNDLVSSTNFATSQLTLNSVQVKRRRPQHQSLINSTSNIPSLEEISILTFCSLFLKQFLIHKRPLLLFHDCWAYSEVFDVVLCQRLFESWSTQCLLDHLYLHAKRLLRHWDRTYSWKSYGGSSSTILALQYAC